MAISQSQPRLRARRAGLGALAFAAPLALLGAAPVLALIVYAAGGDDGGHTRHLFGTWLPTYVAYSVALSALTGLGVGVIGVGAAWLVAMHRFPGRNIFDWALMLPLAAPAYILAYAYVNWLQSPGAVSDFGRALGAATPGFAASLGLDRVIGAALIFSFCLYPYVYLIARRAFAEQAAPLMEAARTLGRGPFGVVKDVLAPLAWPAIAAGGALAVIETLADYGTVDHLGVPTLTAGILRSWQSAGEPVAAARLALILLVFCAALIWVERRARGRRRVSGGTRNQRALPPRRLGAAQGLLAALACLTPIVIGLLLPIGRLAWLAGENGAPDGLAQAALNSAALGLTAALIATLVALAVCAAARAGSFFARISSQIAAAGYAAPGAVAALGALAFFSAAQAGLDAIWSGAGGLAPISLIGGVPALLLAYQTRYAAAALGPVNTALERIAPNLDGAARSLGAGASDVLVRVHWPLARAGVFSAALLVFVEVLKELPATMILRPFNMETLAVMAHNYAHDERLGAAAAPALAIPLLAMVPLALAARALSLSDQARY